MSVRVGLTLCWLGLCVLGAASVRGDQDPEVRPLKFKDAMPEVVRGELGEESVKLQCSTRGSPADSVLWYKDGVEITKDTATLDRHKSTLRILKPIPADGGKYKCVIANAVSSIEHTFTLIVGEVHVVDPVDAAQPGIEIPGEAEPEPEQAASQGSAPPGPRFPWGVLAGFIGTILIILLVGVACWGVTTMMAMKAAAMRQAAAQQAAAQPGQGGGPEAEKMMQV